MHFINATHLMLASVILLIGRTIHASPTNGLAARAPVKLQMHGDKEVYDMVKHDSQGGNSVVYKIQKGFGSKKTPAVAKMFRSDKMEADEIKDEIEFLDKAKRLLASGKTEKPGGPETWAVMKDLSSAEVSGEAMYPLKEIAKDIGKKGIADIPKAASKACVELLDDGVGISDVSDYNNFMFNKKGTKAVVVDLGGAMPAQGVAALYGGKEKYAKFVEGMVKMVVDADFA